MRLSVVISTYNQPRWLELTLWGYACQISKPHELVIADDGSDDRTRAVIDMMREHVGIPVQHVWHEDDGFRKTRILNRAIVASSGDAVLFTDGDCIPRSDFVAVHQRVLTPGVFLSGGYIKLPEVTSHSITPEHVRNGDATRYSWLRAHGMPVTRPLLRLKAGAAGALLDRITPTRASFNGHNATAWRADLLRVNGFNEDMGYGGEDREVGDRLENAGLRGVRIRHRAHTVHLHHGRAYKTAEMMASNRAVRIETARTGRVRAERGITQI